MFQGNQIESFHIFLQKFKSAGLKERNLVIRCYAGDIAVSAMEGSWGSGKATEDISQNIAHQRLSFSVDKL